MRNGLTKTNGIHIVIEDTKKSPSILSNGISVKPGAETNIGLKIGTISRLEAPFARKCRTSYPHEDFDQVRFLAYFEYSAKNHLFFPPPALVGGTNNSQCLCNHNY